jgi:hypothetical protein
MKSINELLVAPILVVMFLNNLVNISKAQFDLVSEIMRESKWLSVSFIEDGKQRAARFMRTWKLDGDET